MRVTSTEKEETRHRIVAAAAAQFRKAGFEAATTRDIAQQAEIAAGTLFNYFPSKEAIVLALAADAFVAADDDFAKSRRAAASPEEDLFLLIATGLRRLKRHRTYLTPLVQVALSPLVPRDWSNDIGAIRGQHFQRVSEILTARGVPNPTPVDLQLYWTLYIGILSYWICDRSPKQEDSRVLIDQSISMFCDWLCRTPEGEAPAKPFLRSAAREQLTEKEQEE